MNEAKNVKEFEALIKLYKAISIKRILAASCDVNALTGFGNPYTCTLCRAVDRVHAYGACRNCVYYAVERRSYACMEGGNKPTYQRIKRWYGNNQYAAEMIMAAYRDRAKHMQWVLGQYKRGLKDE